MAADPDRSKTPPLRLSAGGAGQGPLAEGKVTLVLGGEPVPVQLVVPAAPASTEDMLPVLQGLSSFLAERGASRAEAEGRTISCRAGCGACCRQLAPVASSEAQALARLVEAMPEPRRSQVRARFDEALAALSAAGLTERMNRIAEPAEALGLDYFRLGVACPFLEDEACSIHAERPLICREYLVTSPPENCRAPTSTNIRQVALDAHPSRALFNDESGGWMPLVFALRYADQTPPEPRDRSAPERLREIFERL